MPEMPQPVEVIAEGDLFSLLSCGNGVVYVLRSKQDKTSAFFEGEDSAAFLAEYESTKSAYPNYSADQTLAQLWDQGGYSWMAVPDEA